MAKYIVETMEEFDMPNDMKIYPYNEWVSVKDRLPNPNRLVLCYIMTDATKTYFLAFWNDFQNDWEEGVGGVRLLKKDLGYDVIAWTPILEYKESNK